MNITTADITLHNPSSCTCGRIIWLTMNCDFFIMNLGTNERDARIDAKIGSAYKGIEFRPQALKEVVAEVFWEMWNHWLPAEGIKVTPVTTH
ncbi:hypothetical protein SD961_17750 [Erwinia sp. MMLR14_017]|uniref:hypothetical protein n=1 Tax=Erwinia sp. MMLR14_017 TaxID=3093842 RepID=UPI0029905F4C|nr:hypothetical protein [Erwinia sp. MMLR14_017]MDW8847708.1 hypothetical protein [Erwinia sp. MMLR14_017]